MTLSENISGHKLVNEVLLLLGYFLHWILICHILSHLTKMHIICIVSLHFINLYCFLFQKPVTSAKGLKEFLNEVSENSAHKLEVLLENRESLNGLIMGVIFVKHALLAWHLKTESDLKPLVWLVRSVPLFYYLQSVATGMKKYSLKTHVF